MTQWPDIISISYDEPLKAYWQRRLHQHHNDYYKDRKLMKLPEDLRAYQHLIERVRPEVILEFGTGFGASAVWFADQLDTFCGGGRVVTIGNHEIPRDQPIHKEFLDDPRISFVQGDLVSEDVIDRVYDLCIGKRVMACEDSAHTQFVTFTALDRYSDLIQPGGWFVVEDGIVDEPEISIWNAGGVQPAIREFLATERGKRFRQHNLAFYGVTMHFNGWLEAIP
jgi:cephalosporin hydroxylase